jgi:hypothetical protein
MKFWKLILDNLKVVVIGVIITGLSTLCYLAYESTDLYKVIEYKKEVETKIIPSFNKSQRRQDLKIKWLMNYISDEVEAKSERRNDIAVGLRWNKSKNKFYFRDRNRYYREVFSDTVGMFYNDESNIKIYINFK